MGAPSHVHELVSFEGDAGQLSGTLHVPHSSATVGVVLAHCFTCSRSLKITRSLATGIEDGGYAVLRFDFTGLGDSDGEFDSTSVTTNVSDIVAAARYLRKRGYEQIVLAGHSLGGAATLLAADAVPDAQAIVTVAAPFSVEHVRHLFAEQDIDRARSEGRITVSIAGREFQISRAFFDDLEAHCSPERIAALARPLLVVHGSADRVVGIEEGERIFAAARQPRWFASVPEANHLFTHERHARAAARAIVTFLGTVLPSSSP